MDTETSTAITSREFYPYWIDESVRFADLDPLGHVNNAAISTYFESARVALFSDAGNSPVRGAACIFGCYAPDLNTQSDKAYGGGAYLISGPEMAWYWNHYLARPADRTNPLAAPLLADLHGLPPLYVTAAEFDPLRDDSELLVEKLKAAGADFEFHLWPGTVHACVNLMGWIAAMGPRVDDICAFLKRAMTKR